MTLPACPICADLSGLEMTFCGSCGAPLTPTAAAARARGLLAARGGIVRRSDLIGPERSEGPSFAPRTLRPSRAAAAAACVHRGNIPAQSDISTLAGPSLASSPVGTGPQGRESGCGTLGLASDGIARRPDPFGARARLRDALHGDDGSPGNGRVGA